MLFRSRLLKNDFGYIGELGRYGLNQIRRLDLSMFIKCAEAFDQGEDDDDDTSEEYSKRSRCKVLYRYFNGLSLQYGRDAHRCSQLNHLKFIPRDPAPRTGYEGIDLSRYMQGHILSPTKIVIAEYEAICWSQRGRVYPQPNGALRGTYESLGRPNGEEVVRTIYFLVVIDSQ